MLTEDSAESPSTLPSKAITVMRELRSLRELPAQIVQRSPFEVERQHAREQVGLLFHAVAQERMI